MIEASVIINTESDAFGHKSYDFVAAFAAQRFDLSRFEVIYADGRVRASTINAIESARNRWPQLNLRYVATPGTGRALGHNHGAAMARGDVLIFLADDFEPASDFVAQHVSFHQRCRDERAVAVGPGYFPEAIRRDAFCRWLEDGGSLFGVPMRRRQVIWPQTFFYDGNASLKRRFFARVGTFDERFLLDAWDDFEFGVRMVAAGGYSRFVPAAAWHRHRVSLSERCAAIEASASAARLVEALHPEVPATWRAWLAGGTLKPRNFADIEADIDRVDELTPELLVEVERALHAAFASGYCAASTSS